MRLFKDKVEKLPFVTKAGVGRGIPGLINMTMGVKVDEEHRVDMPVIVPPISSCSDWKWRKTSGIRWCIRCG